MSSFFAWLARLRLIRRWGLMYSAQPENDAEHSLQVAYLAHGLAVLAKNRYGKDVDPEHVMALAMYHDVGEIFTGDLPTPVKHHDRQIRSAYHSMELEALERLLTKLPEDMRPEWRPYLLPDETTLEWQLVKAADRISAWTRCMEEMRCGNLEFRQAGETIRTSIDAIPLPEVQDFMKEFGDSFRFSLDELEESGEQG